MYSYVVICKVLYQKSLMVLPKCTNLGLQTHKNLLLNYVQECTHKQLQVVTNACNASLSL